MRRHTYHRWLLIAQMLIVIGLGVAIIWNALSLILDLASPVWWLVAILPLPGLIGWLGALAAPTLLARFSSSCARWYRLTYDTPSEWRDDGARTALINLINSGVDLEMIWARERDGMGCWLGVSEHDEILLRLVSSVFPAGSLEADQAPQPGTGVVILHWKKEADEAIPSPVELGQLDGIEGVYFRWRSDKTATVALWGTAAEGVARQYVRARDLLPHQGPSLFRPPFAGDNPWPAWPPFPSSQHNAGLAAISELQIVAPALRTNGTKPALQLGHDAEQKSIGFTLPELTGVQPLQIFGQTAEAVTVDLAYQAIQAKCPVLFLDGRGLAVAQLARRMLRETATGQVLTCDVERPAQSRFRLNPLWLPAESGCWSSILSTGWPAWLRDLGVTPGGLGQTAYNHTQVAVILTTLVSAAQGLALDVPGLYDALLAPDFLTMVGQESMTETILTPEIWQWWRTEGRQTPKFDVHLRLGHLRDRLKALLELPEYRVLWRPPYHDPLTIMIDGGSLLWRLPDPRRRLRAYLTSQLLALTTLLTAWPAGQPILLFLHEVEAGAWLERLNTFPAARLVRSATAIPGQILAGESTSLLLSRLSTAEAERMEPQLPGVRAADLRRLPSERLVLKRGQAIGILNLNKNY